MCGTNRDAKDSRPRFFRTPKKTGDPLGIQAHLVYIRTNPGRRETGEFIDKLGAEGWGWGEGARSEAWEKRRFEKVGFPLSALKPGGCWFSRGVYQQTLSDGAGGAVGLPGGINNRC